MKNDTRKIFNDYLQRTAELNGIDDASVKFAATPSVAQTLESRIQETSAFLQNVNSYSVDQQKGEKIGLSIGTTIAGRTDTNTTDRPTQDPSGEDPLAYECKQTDYDTHIKYARLDAWAKFPDFQTRIRDMILRRQALDRIMIGWNGTSAAVQTDRVANPLLQDVNIGWLAKLLAEAPARYMTQGAVAGEVRIGEGNGSTLLPDYKNIDELVYDIRSNLLEPWYARDNNFTSICSSDLLDEKYYPLVGTHGGTPTESNALDLMISNKKLGGLRTAEVPYFKQRSILITQLGKNNESNLSHYWQDGTRRRTIVDNAKRDQIENYESLNEAYVIEDLGAACAVVNIKIWNGTAFV